MASTGKSFFFFFVSSNVCPAVIKLNSKMKYLLWSTTLNGSVFFFFYWIHMHLFYVSLFISIQSKIRHKHVPIYHALINHWQNPRRFFAWRHASTIFALDPRLLMKESGSGISWKGKKERNKQQNFIYVKFIYSVTCC